jgi:hypothetical protein
MRAPSVIPANAGIHFALRRRSKMDPGFRRDDEVRRDGEPKAIRGFELTKHDTNG